MASRDRDAVDDIDELWAAIADPTRRGLLDALIARGEATPTMLAADVPITRQAVSKHLAVLERAQLVEGHREGREIRYRVQHDRVAEATRLLLSVATAWDRRLSVIKRIAEQAHRASRASS